MWNYDFVQERTHDGRVFRILNVIDEHPREGLAIQVVSFLPHILSKDLFLKGLYRLYTIN
jgi:hypothetical protein